MADLRHLHLIRTCTRKKWNKQRDDHSVPDLSYADLQRLNLDGFDLSLADLSCANLRGASLKFCNLEGANLENAILENCDLTGAIIEDANCRSVNFAYSDMRLANLSGSDFTGANFKGVTASAYDIGDFFNNNRTFRDIIEELNYEKYFEMGSAFGESVINLVPVAESIFRGANFSDADISGFAEFSFSNISDARGNPNTRLPDELDRPPHWTEEARTEPQTIREFLEIAQPDHEAIVLELNVENSRIAISKRAWQARFGAAEVFDALKMELAAAEGQLGNVSHTIRQAVNDYANALPPSIELMSGSDQIRIGLLGEIMNTKISAEIREIANEMPDKAGILRSLALSHDALRPALPMWRQYLSDADDNRQTKNNLESIEQSVEEIRCSTLSMQDIFDPEIESRVADFLRVAKQQGSLRKKALEVACWAVENLISYVCRWVRDTLHECMERTKRPLSLVIAGTIITTALTPLMGLAERAPHILGWLPRTIDILMDLLPRM